MRLSLGLALFWFFSSQCLLSIRVLAESEECLAGECEEPSEREAAVEALEHEMEQAEEVAVADEPAPEAEEETTAAAAAEETETEEQTTQQESDSSEVEEPADVKVTAEEESTMQAPSASEDQEQEKPKTMGTPSCPDRDHLMRCAAVRLDTNQNGKLDRPELQSAIDALPWWARGILSILGSVDKMMGKCDVDGDDAISMDYDMRHNEESCLATCFKRRAFRNTFFPDCEL